MDNRIRVHFIRERKTYEVTPGTGLLELIRAEGIAFEAPCGGNGTCGKCRVIVSDLGVVRACGTVLTHDVSVDTVPYSVDFKERAGLAREGNALPVCRKEPADPVTAGASDGRSAHVSGTTDGCSASESGFSSWEKAPYDPPVRPDETFPVCFMAAFDIGTTTVAGYLINAADGRSVASAGCLNPQSVYGADVISRAGAALEKGPELLADCIHGAVNGLLEKMAVSAGIMTTDILAVSIAGNTCMHHLFLGISPASLVRAPYLPAVTEAQIFCAGELNLCVNEHAQVYVLPNIAGFVGADTVACLVSTRLPEQKEWTLLIDIGTNGELVLGQDHRLLACSAAAGPAFEGAGISHGMRAAPGAVSHVRYEERHWKLEVIGGGNPRGICGSGLLDLAAELLRIGMMDETGELEGGGPVILADACEASDEMTHMSGAAESSDEGSYAACEGGVAFTQKDVRQLQLAKAAIASGILLLTEQAGISIDEICHVWIAGAFGSFLSVQSACAIGLIPQSLQDRVSVIGNASGDGARQVLLHRAAWEYAARVAEETEYLELTRVPHFQDVFVDQLDFPFREELSED